MNHTIIDLLGSISLRCEEHNIIARFFCLTHYKPVCGVCKHSGCQVVDAVEEAERVKFQLIGKINETAEELRRENVALPQTLEISVSHVFRNQLKENVDTLQKLSYHIDGLRQLSCMKCAGRGQLTLNTNTLEVYCGNCLT